MKNKQSDISYYRDGKGTPYYEPVIKSIRDFLKNIPEIENSEGGAIIFFEKKSSKEFDLMMKVYPFKHEGVLCDKTCALTELQTLEIFERINTTKPYKKYWHYNLFRQHHNSKKHCNTAVPEKNVIIYDKNEIQYHSIVERRNDNGESEIKIEKKTDKWSAFFKDFTNNNVEKNTYEQLLFESGCEGVSFIPIPVLSTPSILLVLNIQDLEENQKGLLRSLYFRSRDTVDSYLYSRLLDSLAPYLETYGEECSEEELVNYFVKEICNIILPISYKINNGKEEFYYKDWSECSFEPIYTLPLLDGKYKVEFRLTSFHYVDLEDSSNNKWKWIHDSELFKSNCHQSALLVCKLFKMFHNNWKLIKSAEERAYIKISQAISHIPIQSLKDIVNQMETEFNEIKLKKDELGIYAPVNQLLIDEGKISLTIDAVQLISPIDFTNKEVAKQSGFYYLKYILAKAKTNGNKFSISVNDLYEHVDVPKKGKIIPEFANKKLSASKIISEQANDICEILFNFYQANKDEISYCLRNKKISTKKEFNQGVYYFFKMLSEFNLNKTINYFTPNIELAFLKHLKELLNIYEVDDKPNTHVEMNKHSSVVKEYFKIIKSAKVEKSKDDDGINRQQFVRECFQAMIKLLRSKRDKANVNSIKSFDRLLTNLEQSGLIQDDKDEAVSQTSYSYNQTGNKEVFIDWRF